MKALITTVIVLLVIAGVVVKLKSDHRQEIFLYDLKIAELNKELATSRGAAAQAAADLAAANTHVSQQITDPKPDPALARAALETRMAKLRRIFDEHSADIARRKSQLLYNRSLAEVKVQEIKANPPKFSEHTIRAGNGGKSQAATGVRTSAADRVRLNAEHAEKLTAASAQVASFDALIREVDAELDRLQVSYDRAVKEAKDLAGR